MSNPVWTFAAGPWDGLPTTALPVVTSRTATLRLVGNSEASITVDGTRPEAAAVQELIWDLWLIRNKQTVFRGRIGASSDTVDPGSDPPHGVQFAAADYRAVLDRRLVLDGDTIDWSGDSGTIAWDLVGQTQAKPGGGLGIAQGLTLSGAAVSVSFEVGSTVANGVNVMSQGVTGFDWDILPTSGSKTQAFTVFAPERGTDRNITLAYPYGRVASLTRTADPGTFANVVRYTGGQTLTPELAVEVGIGTDPAGRFETQIGDTTILDQPTLHATAAGVLARQETVTPSWVVTMLPNSWGGPDDIGLGDPVTLAVTSGRLQVLETLRVYEIGISLDDSGTETVTITLGTVDPDLRWHPREFDARLTALERR